MARYQYGRGMADYVVVPVDGLWGVVPGAVVEFWSQEIDGVQYTDLQDATGAPITQVVADAQGFIPTFFGPDGVTGMWASAGGNARAWMEGHHTGNSGSGGGPVTAESFNTNSAVRSAFLKTTSAAQHAATIYQASRTGEDVAVALNVISDNRESSAMYLTGHEKVPRGTLKITHVNGGELPADDAGASALSIDLRHGTAGGTASQGVFVNATDGPTTGNLIVLRNNRDDFVVKGSGRTGVGMAIGEVPEAALEVKQNDTGTPGLAVNGIAAGQALLQVKPASGLVAFEVGNTGSTVHRGVTFLTNHLQMGATSADVGGAVGAVISMKNVTTPPAGNPSGGGILYVEGGALKYKGSAGTVTTIAPA